MNGRSGGLSVSLLVYPPDQMDYSISHLKNQIVGEEFFMSGTAVASALVIALGSSKVIFPAKFLLLIFYNTFL